MLKNNDFRMKSVLIAMAFMFALALSALLHLSLPVSGAETNANAAAGSADDPLVTLSYVNKAISEALNGNQSQANQNQNQNLYVMSAEASASSYDVLELTKGQRVRAKSGSLELILRPDGKAEVISEYITQGIADLTTGGELLNGKSLPTNHSLLIPRADNRGILITSVIAYVMVRGDYEIY